ncbi:MAG: glycosyltransferase family 2 protein [Oscillospiraceae bacterium]
MKDKVLLFIPAYNCEKQIVRVLAQIDSEVMQWVSKIVVVNNRSTDNTEQAVLNYANEYPLLPLVLLRNDENYVLGGSHKVAFDYAIKNNYDYIIVLHGDDQGDIHDVLPLFKSGNYAKYDCCLGARFIKGAKLYGYSALRKWANRGFNLMFSIVCGRMIYDLGSGLNLYKVEMLKNRFYVKFPDKLSFNDVMVLASTYYKHSMNFFPITWKEDDQVSNVKMFHFGCLLIDMAIRFLFTRKKFIESEMREKIIENYTYTIIFDAEHNS